MSLYSMAKVTPLTSNVLIWLSRSHSLARLGGSPYSGFDIKSAHFYSIAFQPVHVNAVPALVDMIFTNHNGVRFLEVGCGRPSHTHRTRESTCTPLRPTAGGRRDSDAPCPPTATAPTGPVAVTLGKPHRGPTSDGAAPEDDLHHPHAPYGDATSRIPAPDNRRQHRTPLDKSAKSLTNQVKYLTDYQAFRETFFGWRYCQRHSGGLHYGLLSLKDRPERERARQTRARRPRRRCLVSHEA